ncbi:MAG: hypothetical protein U1A78_37495 [Polyangia bacterium]
MTDPLARLRVLLDSASAAVPAGVTPEARVTALEAELHACFAGMLAAKTPVSLAELQALADAFRDRCRTLPAEVERAHFDWLRLHKGWYKLVPGPDGRPRAPELPPGTPSAALTLTPQLYERIAELRYALHRRAHPAACDCAARIASGRFREPSSPDLRSLGQTTDGYYTGDEFLCGSCGARWFRGIGDDDRGSTFWEPIRSS